ncbi:MAG TPA: hypothetical protein VE404_04880 [Verrucomicrobiae bacterium]|nr:hypothetical protein [Verrucomicrobiae bacterium]
MTTPRAAGAAILAVAAVLSLTAASPVRASGPEPADHACPMMDSRAAGVDGRGDAAMGFDHAKTTHHFSLAPDGGAIQVGANSPDDTASRDMIRTHLRHVATMFGNGDFAIPMLVHAQDPPGAAVMARLKGKISYEYQETEGGGRVRIRTADPEALGAIHEFLEFQIRDHRTGDPIAPSSPSPQGRSGGGRRL